VFALVAVPVAWWAARAVFGTRTAWIAAVLAATSPFLTQYAQEARMYALAALLGALVAAAHAGPGSGAAGPGPAPTYLSAQAPEAFRWHGGQQPAGRVESRRPDGRVGAGSKLDQDRDGRRAAHVGHEPDRGGSRRGPAQPVDRGLRIRAQLPAGHA
jgi:hypothetical protein